MKISVIMPVYNMQEYIGEAIESFLQQSLKEIELICIDDCSTDSTRDIIIEYMKKYDNIILHTMDSNSGVGAVRRKAMKLATGEYIAFLDADDLFLEDTALEILYNNAAKEKIDVCGGEVINFSLDKVMTYPRFCAFFDGDTNLVDLKYDALQDDYFFQGFIYRRSFIEEEKLEFPPLIRYEDPPFYVRSLHRANKIRAVNIKFYGHRIGHKEIVYTIEAVTDLLNGLIMNLEYAYENRLDKLFDKTIERLNNDYFKDLVYALNFYNQNFMERLLYANKLAEKRNLKLFILEYFLFLHRSGDKLEEFMTLEKCRKGLRDVQKIIIYGAGEIGEKVHSVIQLYSDYKVVRWIDHYKAGNIVHGITLCDIDVLDFCIEKYDCVLIAIANADISQQIKNDLISRKIDVEKIIEWTNI